MITIRQLFKGFETNHAVQIADHKRDKWRNYLPHDTLDLFLVFHIYLKGKMCVIGENSTSNYPFWDLLSIRECFWTDVCCTCSSQTSKPIFMKRYVGMFLKNVLTVSLGSGLVVERDLIET